MASRHSSDVPNKRAVEMMTTGQWITDNGKRVWRVTVLPKDKR